MTAFSIYPAIDIRGGNCVRLKQGDYNEETVYHDSPVHVAKQFESEGSRYVHVVDLDGAKQKEPVNFESIKAVIESTNLLVQVGGGIRTEAHIKQYLDAGANRVILGSIAVAEPEFTKEMLAKYGKRIVIGLDARDGYVAVNGWLEASEARVEVLASEMKQAGCETFIFTDIHKDGMMEGPNVEANQELAEKSGANIITSGGVSSNEDIYRLLELRKYGVTGAIIGKALYTDVIELPSLLQEVERRCSQND
ncbi:1-(5-phosphoribosyl)-5-[(5-phosphoribosylamino)methylideneamino] imidazole-4-carboxamide isomerase [Bacillaceae bacterium JMAK1]|nr:1-(5-phosphoribosyl)-5-[(5-phosphoribosylamino)methylideneamino] imidazole-4-carboxamide isomerase [Bacillaceae bacterium JMAK1]